MGGHKPARQTAPFGKHRFLRMSTGVILHVHLSIQGRWLRPDLTGTPLKQVRQENWDCGAPVAISRVGGRTAYFCPVEQAT